MNVTKLIPDSAKQAHNEILLALGSENNPRQWMLFCESIDKHIPSMSLKGRLSNKEVEQSLIGQLGFKSFKEYIETDLENGGLGWSSGGWNAYRRAWSLVKQYPYLRELNIKSGWLNAFANKLRKSEIEFPESLEEYNNIQEYIENERNNNKDAKIDDQAKLITQLEDTQLEFKFKLAKSQELLSNANAKIETFDKLTNNYLNKIQSQAEKINELNSQLKKLKNKKLTRWEALMICLFGN